MSQSVEGTRLAAADRDARRVLPAMSAHTGGRRGMLAGITTNEQTDEKEQTDMAEQQRIVGRNGVVTIIGGETPCITGVADPPEDQSRWHSPQCNYRDVLRRYDWNDAQFNAARGGLGFPRSINGGVTPASMRWRVEHLDEWEDRIRAMASRLPKKR